MVTDFGNLAKRANEKRGTSLADAFPQFKPFVPPVSDFSPEAYEYQRKYDSPPPNVVGDEIRQGILNAQLAGRPINEDLRNRPLANYGSQGMDYFDILPLPFNLQGAGALYADHDMTEEGIKRQPTIYDTRKILGETERFINDFIVTTKDSDRDDVKHELIHRAFSKLRRLYRDYKGFPGSAASLSSFNKLDLREEDVVQLLDFISGARTSKISGDISAEWYFKGGKDDPSPWTKRGKEPTTPQELVQKPEILKLLMAIQQLAVEELKKQNIDTGRPRIPFAPIPKLFADVLK